MKKTILKSTITLSTLLYATIGQASYIAGADFITGEKPDGSEVNPRGAWSYGYRSTLESTSLTLVSAHFDSTTDVNGAHDELEGYSDTVGIYANTGISPVVMNFGAGDLMPLNAGQMSIHPGGANEYAIVRWTSTVTSSYDIQSTWVDIDTNGGNGITAHILVNGVSLAGQGAGVISNGGSGVRNYSSELLNAGDVVDFATGTNGDNTYDTTSFNATITDLATVPVPAAVWLFGSGLIGLIGVARRK